MQGTQSSRDQAAIPISQNSAVHRNDFCNCAPQFLLEVRDSPVTMYSLPLPAWTTTRSEISLSPAILEFPHQRLAQNMWISSATVSSAPVCRSLLQLQWGCCCVRWVLDRWCHQGAATSLLHITRYRRLKGLVVVTHGARSSLKLLAVG